MISGQPDIVVDVVDVAFVDLGVRGRGLAGSHEICPDISRVYGCDTDAMPAALHFLVRSVRELGIPDAVVIPGTKNTTWDLDYIRRTGMADAVQKLVGRVPLVGICGGYQMLGRTLHDPDRLESELGSVQGLGLLDFEVTFHPHKTLARRDYIPTRDNPFAAAGRVAGYEIHCGEISYGTAPPAFHHEDGVDGAVDPEHVVVGTSIHDVFTNPAFTREFINLIRRNKGLAPLTEPLSQPRKRFEDSYDQLAAELDRLEIFR